MGEWGSPWISLANVSPRSSESASKLTVRQYSTPRFVDTRDSYRLAAVHTSTIIPHRLVRE
jgi:hypothetical protein